MKLIQKINFKVKNKNETIYFTYLLIYKKNMNKPNNIKTCKARKIKK